MVYVGQLAVHSYHAAVPTGRVAVCSAVYAGYLAVHVLRVVCVGWVAACLHHVVVYTDLLAAWHGHLAIYVSHVVVYTG